MNEPYRLYHYTSMNTLFAIINGIDNNNQNNVFFTLRATHASFLNDETEGKLLPMALKNLGVSENSLFIIECLQGYPFVISLSELEDDLNMWRCYANNGTGIAIGLNQKTLKEIFNDELKIVQYVTIENLEKILNSQDIHQMMSSENKLQLHRLLYKTLEYKDLSFAAEKEWRIYKHFIEDGFRVSNGQIIPYLNVRVPISAIETIMLGPKTEFDKNRFAIYRMLKSKISPTDLDNIMIIKSRVPLT